MSPNASIFGGVGSFSLAKQSTNDLQIYAYLNAPANYAGLRRLRFRDFTYPGTRSATSMSNGFKSEWEMRTYVVYVDGSGAGKCDEYINGTKVGATHSVDYTGDTSTPNGSITIGNGASGSLGCGSSLDEPRIWKRALTATEVSDLYYNGLTRGSAMSTGLVGEWLFNEGSGTTALDTSGSGNNGTITGATYTTDVFCQPRSNA